jgi:hypothetical protein
MLNSQLVGDGTRIHTLALDLLTSGPIAEALQVRLPRAAKLMAARGPNFAPIDVFQGEAGVFELLIPGSDQPFLVTLEYRFNASDALLVSDSPADLPTFSWPCLAFSQSLATGQRKISLPRGGTPSTTFEESFRPWWFKQVAWNSNDAARKEALSLLQAPIDLEARHIRSLADLFSHIEEPNRPVFIDRGAIRRLGVALDEMNLSSTTSPQPRESVLAVLDSFGLSANPANRSLIIHEKTRPAFDDKSDAQIKSAIMKATVEAREHGYDEFDELGRMTHWREEALLSMRPHSRLGPGTSPVQDTLVSLEAFEKRPAPVSEDAGFQNSVTWLAALVILLFSFSGSRLSKQTRGVWVAFALVLCGLLTPLSGVTGVSCWLGLCMGVLVVCIYWAMAGNRRDPEKGRLMGKPRSLRTRAMIVPCVLTLVCAVHAAGEVLVRAQPLALPLRDGASQETVLAFIPFDQASDPVPDAERVLLSLSDYEKLVAIRDTGKKKLAAMRQVESDGFGAISASHRLLRRASEVTLLSEYTFELSDQTACDWKIPLAEAVQVSAQIDGHETTVRLVEGEPMCRVTLEGKGRHTLLVSQQLQPAIRSNRKMPVAHVSNTILQNLQRDELGQAGTIAWLREAAKAGDRVSLPPCSTVTGLLTWDVLGLGDHVMAQLCVDSSSSVPTVSFTLDADWFVMSAPIPGHTALLSSQPAAEAGLRQWRIDFSPPLTHGDLIEIELLRAGLESTLGSSYQYRMLPSLDGPGLHIKHCTLVTKSGVWRSALHSHPQRNDRENNQAESTDRDAGEEPPTLVVLDVSGAALRQPWIFAAIENEARVKQNVTVIASPGLLEVLLEAFISQSGQTGECWQELEIPEDLTLVDISGPGLRGWRQVTRNQIVLNFEPTEARERPQAIRIRAKCHLEATQTGGWSRAIPWFEWPGATLEDSELAIVGWREMGVHAESRPGMTRVDIPSPESNTQSRVVFRVPAESKPGRLSVGEPAPRAKVQVQSYLNFYPEMIEWLALARYEVRNGPCREIRLELPEGWAEGAEFQMLDSPARTRLIDEGGRKIVVLTPIEEAWGEQRVLVQARRSRLVEEIEFPSIVPLGLGQVTTLLAWSNQSNRRLITEGSAGIQEVDPSRFLPFEPAALNTASLHVYRALRGGWHLRFVDESAAPEGDFAYASGAAILVDVDCSIGAQGTVIGQTRCTLLAPTGSSLAFALPQGAKVLKAYRDATLVPVYHDPDRKTCRVFLESARTRHISDLASSDFGSFFREDWTPGSATGDGWQSGIVYAPYSSRMECKVGR